MIQSTIKSFSHAVRGIAISLFGERNMRIHFAAVILVAFAGYYYEISSLEWLALLLCISMVIGLELVNSSIERICDFVESDLNSKIRDIKDISAGAVLWVSFVSVVVAAIVFIPKI